MSTSTDPEAAIGAATDSGRRLIWQLAWALSGSLVIIAALFMAVVGGRHADHASAQAQAQCQLDKTIAESPLTGKTTDLGVRILVGARIAYVRAGCTLGPLAPPDPRILPHLPADVRRAPTKGTR